MSSRRENRHTDAIVESAAASASRRHCRRAQAVVEVNDMQSQLNRTRVERIVTPQSLATIQATLRRAERKDRPVSIAGGRHAMGGQQFASRAILLDMREFRRVVHFDRANGHITVEAGIEWPDLIGYLHREQVGENHAWAVREKQTGVDRVSIGGSLASNIHGRSLRSPPIISDVEAFLLVDAKGKLHHCSRRENTALFSLAIGGYGLFGVIAQVTLRLVPRTVVQRAVEVIAVKDLLPWLERRLDEGYVYGDCQYAIDLDSEAEMHAGVFSCYRPIAEGPLPKQQKQLTAADWANLYRLTRTDKRKAFETYSRYYLGTSGQAYWSDAHQLVGNFEGYREAVDANRGTEMITEVYVSKDAFLPFMTQARQDFLDHNVDMTYGTIRFIEKDAESFLPWATVPAVCIVCNLHVRHTPAGIRKAVADFRRIIDRVIQFGGRFYLTYHRWATRSQVQHCYPQFGEFLRLKRKYDPAERFQSNWYRQYRGVLRLPTRHFGAGHLS